MSSPFARLTAPPRPRGAPTRVGTSADEVLPPTTAAIQQPVAASRPSPYSRLAASASVATDPASDPVANPFARLATAGAGDARQRPGGMSVDAPPAEIPRASRALSRSTDPSPNVPRLVPTEEQLAAIESRSQIVVGNAYAGGGKTTTGIMYCERHPQEDILYLTFNASNQADLQQKIRARGLRRARALTTHAAARRALMDAGRLKSEDILEQWNAFSVREMLVQIRQIGAGSNYRLAALTQRVLDEFFKSESRFVERFVLSRTWRFGSNIADIANLILQEFKGETTRIRGMGPTGPRGNGPLAHLSRTNATLYALAFDQDGRGIHWNGGIARYPLQDAVDAWNLKTRNLGGIKNPFLRRFESWQDLVDYSEAAKDQDVKQLVKLIETYGDAIPSKVDQIRANAVKDQAQAELVLSTAFISKGGEWDEVRIADDFEYLLDAEESLTNGRELTLEQIQEINLGYVAYTRAKHVLHLNPETETWIAKLDYFRRKRRVNPAESRHASSGSRMRGA